MENRERCPRCGSGHWYIDVNGTASCPHCHYVLGSQDKPEEATVSPAYDYKKDMKGFTRELLSWARERGFDNLTDGQIREIRMNVELLFGMGVE